MKDLYETMEEMCGYLTPELAEVNERVKNARGRISSGDLEYIDKLTHAIKSIKTTMAMIESGYSNMRYSGNHDWTHTPTVNYSNATRRDSMGRYSRSKDSMVTELHELMMEAPDEATRMKFQRFIDEMKQP